MRTINTANEKLSTDQIPQPVTFVTIKNRVNALKFRTSSKSFSLKHNQFDLEPDKQVRAKPASKLIESQNDTFATNFWPGKPSINLISTEKQPEKQTLQKRSQDSKIIRPQSHTIYTRSRFRIQKNSKKQKDGRVDAITFMKQVKYLSTLYQLLGNVLGAIREGFKDVEKAIVQYGEFIRDPYLNFIDEFTATRSQKIKKTLRISRIHEYLSIAYLFLEMAQDRIANNQSYLVNFVGYSLSNLIFLARIYILSQKRPEFEDNQFEKSVERFEIANYGHPITQMDDALLRVQHNNQIITMIHKKLGLCNQKFEDCIRAFLKNADRRKYTTCLCAHYIFQYLAMHIHETQLVGISQFLQVSPTPYLAPPEHQYTLVFQPLGIIKSEENLRPYLMQFVKWASKYFDLVLWTWEMPSEVQNLVELLDPYLFSKLYRYHCIIKDGIYTKDLHRLGRDLKKTLIIDYDERIFAMTPKNGFVSRWKGKTKDKGLLIICEVLEELVASQSEVEDMLKFYAQQILCVRGF